MNIFRKLLALFKRHRSVKISRVVDVISVFNTIGRPLPSPTTLFIMASRPGEGKSACVRC